MASYVYIQPRDRVRILVNKDKIERMFNVTVGIQKHLSSSLCTLEGDRLDKIHATSYVQALVMASGTKEKTIYLPPNCPDVVIENIEKSTHAVIGLKHESNRCEYFIRGSLLAMTMAMTLLEDIVQDNEHSLDSNLHTPIANRPSKASRRLSTVLQQTITKTNKKGNIRTATDAVKVAIASCLLDEETSTRENVEERDKEDNASVILIDDDSDDDIIVLSDDSDDGDDEVLMIETPRKPNASDNLFFDSSPILTDTTLSKEQDISDNQMDTLTQAMEELQTPSTLKKNEGTRVSRPHAAVRPLTFHSTSKNTVCERDVEFPDLEDELTNVENTIDEEKSKKKKKSKKSKKKDKSNTLQDVNLNEDQINVENKMDNEKSKKKNRPRQVVTLEEELTNVEHKMDDDQPKKKKPKKSKKRKKTVSELDISGLELQFKDRRDGADSTDGKRKSKKRRMASVIVVPASDDEITMINDKVSKRKSTTKRKKDTKSDRHKEPKKIHVEYIERKSLGYNFETFAEDKENKNFNFTEKGSRKSRWDITPQSYEKMRKTDGEKAQNQIDTISSVRATNNKAVLRVTTNETGRNVNYKHSAVSGRTFTDQKERETLHDRRIVVSNCLQPPHIDRPVVNGTLRYIVIDGSNVAMSHGGNGKVFSCRGIRICVEYFRSRGHTMITAFLPHWRKCRPSGDVSVTQRYELDNLEKEGILVYTPSRKIGNKLVASYDDRFIVELAEREEGVIVSNDQYRDLQLEKRSWRAVIERRLLMYTFVRDHFMVPEDPLGKNGPPLDEFLCQPKKKRQMALPTIHNQVYSPRQLRGSPDRGMEYFEYRR